MLRQYLHFLGNLEGCCMRRTVHLLRKGIKKINLLLQIKMQETQNRQNNIKKKYVGDLHFLISKLTEKLQ